jgi:hypothetical protein
METVSFDRGRNAYARRDLDRAQGHSLLAQKPFEFSIENGAITDAGKWE